MIRLGFGMMIVVGAGAAVVDLEDVDRASVGEVVLVAVEVVDLVVVGVEDLAVDRVEGLEVAVE